MQQISRNFKNSQDISKDFEKSQKIICKISKGYAKSQRILKDLKRSQKRTFTIVTKGVKAAFYDGAIQILISALFFEKMAVHKDAHELSLCNDARLDATT